MIYRRRSELGSGQIVTATAVTGSVGVVKIIRTGNFEWPARISMMFDRFGLLEPNHVPRNDSQSDRGRTEDGQVNDIFNVVDHDVVCSDQTNYFNNITYSKKS